MEAIKYKVVSMKGEDKGSIELDPRVFGADVNETLVHETVRWQLARRRAGTQSVLGRADMKGGGKKPWRQKGTGNARAGSNTSPLWVGGGQVHAPKPRCYDYRLPKRTRTQALVSVLSEKVSSNSLVILDDLAVESGKTKQMVEILEKIGVGANKAVLVVAEENAKLSRSANNIANLSTLKVDGVNVYDLLCSKYIVSTRKGIEAIQERVKKSLSN